MVVVYSATLLHLWLKHAMHYVSIKSASSSAKHFGPFAEINSMHENGALIHLNIKIVVFGLLIYGCDSDRECCCIMLAIAHSLFLCLSIESCRALFYL